MGSGPLDQSKAKTPLRPDLFRKTRLNLEDRRARLVAMSRRQAFTRLQGDATDFADADLREALIDRLGRKAGGAIAPFVPLLFEATGEAHVCHHCAQF
jgi:hypothetical protein